MTNPSPSIRALAEQLIALEAANSHVYGLDMPVALRVSEKLRTFLAQLVGVDGFTALQRRALALARADVPSLQTARVSAEGRLEGLQDVESDDEAAIAITAHFLGLLVTFLGGPLALRLTRGAFPDLSGHTIIEAEES